MRTPEGRDRRGRFREWEESATTLPLTSMLDMIFILLIFVMVSVQFAPLGFVNLELPGVRHLDRRRENALRIALSWKGQIRFNGREVSLTVFDRELSGLNPAGRGVHLYVDRRAPFGIFAQILAILRRENCYTIQIVTDRKEN